MNMALAPTAVTQIQTAGEMKSALQVVKDALAPDLTDSELTLFAMVAQRSGLDPFAKQIYAVKRKGRVTFQTGIDGLRSIAERTGGFDGSDEPQYGEPCDCGKAPKPHPVSARVTVYRVRNGERRGQSATAHFHEYMPDGGQDFQWQKMPRLMLGKCAEALALRKAFPYVLSDIYTPEEMDQAPRDEPAPAKRPTARELVAEKAAATRAPADPEFGPDHIDGQVVDVVDEATAIQGEQIDEAIEGELIEEAEAEPPEPIAACGDVAADGIAQGEICRLDAGHRGAHKSATASWPQAKASDSK